MEIHYHSNDHFNLGKTINYNRLLLTTANMTRNAIIVNGEDMQKIGQLMYSTAVAKEYNEKIIQAHGRVCDVCFELTIMKSYRIGSNKCIICNSCITPILLGWNDTMRMNKRNVYVKIINLENALATQLNNDIAGVIIKTFVNLYHWPVISQI